jgi:ABC-type transporter Mla subunit MlaD
LTVVADNANGLITEVRGELHGISGDARTLLANLNTVTGQPNQRKIRELLDNVNGMLATERPKLDRLTDQLNVLSQHADETIENVNGTVSEVREPVRKDLAELQETLLEAKHLMADMQVLVRTNDDKIGDTIENLRTATENLDDLTESVKQRPWSLIRIKEPEDRKVPK